ncbi:MAG: hypothetical protein NTY31_03575 [Candidatus Falkowbacteria bacterium]|nr:hypothetical protein [Candidatus Falkowbacteria bacterium]
MVSPNLAKHSEDDHPVEISDDAKKLFQIIYSEKNKKEEIDEDIPKIKVSTLISRVAFFYEKVRNAVDYEEEHLLRKNAIARILRRQIVIEGVVLETDGPQIANHLLVELIRGSYLSNNTIPETKISEIAGLLEKYIRLKNKIAAKINIELNLKTDINKAKDLIGEKNNLIHWLLNLAACEIEENLTPNPVKQTIVDNLFSVLQKNIKLPADLPYEADLEIQIYLSIDRTFLKFDADMLGFVLFKYYNPEWLGISSQEELSGAEDAKIEAIASHVLSLRDKINAQLAHPLIKQLDKIVRVYALYFSILSETIDSDPAKVYSELQKGEKSFVALIRKVCNKKYLKAKSRLWRAALRGIIYIFLTKSIFVILIEAPAIKFFNEPLNPISLAINIAFPAALLFFIVFLTRTPQDNNTDKIVSGIKEIAFAGSGKKQPIMLRRHFHRNWLKNGIFHLIYAASFCFSVFVVIWALDKINFNWVSIIIFLFFLAFVSFFSVLTTKGVKELIIVERRENLFTFLLDLFYMPIILVGRWLSGEFAKINVFIFLFDFIIEAPFKVLVEIMEDWTKYVRERRDNM